MTDVRNTENYETVLGDGPGDVRETQNYQTVLGSTPPGPVRETQAYQTVLGTTPPGPVRETENYQFVLGGGPKVARDTLTYFYVLANIGEFVEAECGFLSVMFPQLDGLAAPIDAGPLAFVSTFGPTGDIL